MKTGTHLYGGALFSCCGTSKRESNPAKAADEKASVLWTVARRQRRSDSDDGSAREAFLRKSEKGETRGDSLLLRQTLNRFAKKSSGRKTIVLFCVPLSKIYPTISYKSTLFSLT